MKKSMLMLLVIITSFGFTPKHDVLSDKKTTLTRTVFEPTNPQPQEIFCICVSGSVYWGPEGDCCCDIHCTVYTSTGGVPTSEICSFTVRNCSPMNPNIFVTNPLTDVPTLYSIGTNLSLPDGISYTTEQIAQYQNFKTKGRYTVTNEISKTDASGNITIFKAGVYEIVDGNLKALVSRTNL